jgi:hypothetical protein
MGILSKNKISFNCFILKRPTMENLSADELFELSDPEKFIFHNEETQESLENLSLEEKRDHFYQYGHDWSWAVRPEKDQWEKLIRILSEGPILEIAAGNGFWKRLFGEKVPVEWICTDDETWKCPCGKPTFIPIEEICAGQAIKKYSAKTLLISWPPPPKESLDVCILDAVSGFQGSQLVYVGTPPGGETTTPPFFVRLFQWWDLSDSIPLEKSLLGDKIWVYSRRQTPRSTTLTNKEFKRILQDPQTDDEKLLAEIFSEMKQVILQEPAFEEIKDDFEIDLLKQGFPTLSDTEEPLNACASDTEEPLNACASDTEEPLNACASDTEEPLNACASKE